MKQKYFTTAELVGIYCDWIKSKGMCLKKSHTFNEILNKTARIMLKELKPSKTKN